MLRFLFTGAVVQYNIQQPLNRATMRSLLQLIIDLYIMSKITIERPFVWCNQSNINIYIDDQKVGELNGGKSIDFEVQPGTHKVAVKKKSMGFNRPIVVDVGNDENKTIKVTSLKYGRMLAPFLLILLFGIYYVAISLLHLEKHYIWVIALYGVIIFAFMYLNARHFYYKLEESITN